MAFPPPPEKTHRQIINHSVFKGMLFSEDPGVLVALQEHVASPMPEKQKGRSAMSQMIPNVGSVSGAQISPTAGRGLLTTANSPQPPCCGQLNLANSSWTTRHGHLAAANLMRPTRHMANSWWPSCRSLLAAANSPWATNHRPTHDGQLTMEQFALGEELR